MADQNTGCYYSNDENLSWADQILNGICPECGTRKSHLFEHLFLDHSYSKERIDEAKRQKRIWKVLSDTNEAYFCEVCGLIYKTKKILTQHKKKKHGMAGSTHMECCLLCPLCEERFKNHWALIKHANEKHAISHDQYMIETATFEDRTAFENWKTQLENEAAVRFSVVTRRNYARLSVTYMRCSSSKPSRAYGNGRLRSKKLVDNCTAFMKVADSGDRIKVKFCRTHCGHKLQPALLPINNTSRASDVVAPATSFGEKDDDAFLLVQQCDIQAGRNDTYVLDANKELLQEFELVSAALQRKLIQLSNIADAGVQDCMKEIINLMRDMDVKVSEEIAKVFRTTTVAEIGRVAEMLHIWLVDPRKQFWWYDTMSLRRKQLMLGFIRSVKPSNCA